MLDKIFKLIIRLMCFSFILLITTMMMTDIGGRNISHPILYALGTFAISMFVFRNKSPIAGLAVCFVINIVLIVMNGGGDIFSELGEAFSPLLPYIVGFGIFYLVFLKPQRGTSESSTIRDSKQSERQKNRRNSELAEEKERERMKAWGQPVESGSCPYLLRIEMGYYEGWDCYRCARTGATFDDGFCRNLCYYEDKYRYCRARE